jgi:hypothetical protein
MPGVRSVLGFSKLLAQFGLGYTVFAATGRTPHYAYESMRQLYCRTNGRMNDFMSRLSGLVHRPYRLDGASGVLGNLDPEAIDVVATNIRERGFHVFTQRLPEEACSEMERFALEQSAFPYTDNGADGETTVYDPDRWISTKYEFEEQALLQAPTVRRLLADCSILAVAQAYLGSKPVLDLISMWWSTAFSRQASSRAAQLYHFDMDRLKFIKFFIYLTDVGPDNGPHVYVSGSVKRKPRELLRDGRIPDADVEAHYPRDAVMEITGPRGTIFAADTRGLHKGKPLRTGHRLLLQLEFANSLFGQSWNALHCEDGANGFDDVIRRYPYTFSRLRNGPREDRRP